MKRLSFLLFSVIIMPFATMAQFAVNPQLGMTMQKLTDAPEGAEYKAALGAMIGLDMRIGDRFYFQPGGFFERNSTVVSVGDSLVVEDNLVRSNLKLKALVGYNLIDGDGFRLRFNTGPTYDVLSCRAWTTRMTRSNGTRTTSTPVPSIGTLGSERTSPSSRWRPA